MHGPPILYKELDDACSILEVMLVILILTGYYESIYIAVPISFYSMYSA